jgi:hypothetical protein
VIAYPEQLLERLRKLLDTVGPLGGVGVVGYSEPDRAKVDTALALVAGSKQWTFADWRGAAAARPAASSKDATLVIVARSAQVDPVLDDLVRGHSRKHLADNSAENQGALLILLEDCREPRDVMSREIGRVGFWDFVA